MSDQDIRIYVMPDIKVRCLDSYDRNSDISIFRLAEDDFFFAGGHYVKK